MRTSVTCRIALLLSVLVLVVSGCTDEQTQPTDLPDLSESNPTELAPSADEQAIVSAYKGYFETLLKLGGADGDTIRSMLSPYATGVAVERVVKGMANYQAMGQEPGGVIVFSDIQVGVSGESTATTTECRDGSTETIVDSSTKQTITVGVPKTLIQGTLEKQPGGTWRVSDYDAEAGGC